MYYLTKIFEMPISHRLSCHQGKCRKFHGHNLIIEVTIKSEKLNENSMVMDFSELKKIVSSLINTWDHGMFINKRDKEEVANLECYLHVFDSDPTSEILCKYLYDKMKEYFIDSYGGIFVHSVAIWETKNSKSIYLED